MTRKQERDAWTASILGAEAPAADKPRKYRNERVGKYDSKHEAEVAGNLQTLARAGKITDLVEQEVITLVPGKLLPNGRKLRAITYRADFSYLDLEGKKHILDAKGVRTTAYKLKKHLALLLLDIEIEEV